MLDKEKFDIISKEYCSGCGNCAVVCGEIVMKFVKNGHYLPYYNKENNNINFRKLLEVCPFSDESLNEDSISTELFSKQQGINYSKNIGYFYNNYASYVKVGNFRSEGGSGGFGSWIASKLLEENKIDYVVHVKKNSENRRVLFNYSISSTKDEICSGAKSKYYPIELSETLKRILQKDGRYLVIGVPCFLKALRLIAKKEPVITKRVKYTVGLVCGHMKSDLFARSMAFEKGINPDKLEEIDFRVKLSGEKSSKYGIYLKGESDNQKKNVTASNASFFTTNWGLNFFKINACDYCDDVLAETADITIGDAWLPKYIKDPNGTNILIIRNRELLEFIEYNEKELYLDDLSVSDVYLSQSGGFRHKQEGLAYRLYKLDQQKKYRPIKRVQPENKLNKNRRNVYSMRVNLASKSFSAYWKAYKCNDFDVFKSIMNPYIKEYNKALGNNILKKIVRKFLQYFRS